MTPVSLTVNGRKVAAMVEPRTHLGDFLREHCRLTGTHLGCEHGVCGACTVLIDEEPVRSCIAFAVACDGQTVRTIEGFEDDALMQRLREAFARVAAPGREPDSRGARRQPLSVHRLSRHRRRRAQRGRDAGGRSCHD